jgi:hypothetical protein
MEVRRLNMAQLHIYVIKHHIFAWNTVDTMNIKEIKTSIDYGPSSEADSRTEGRVIQHY